MLQTSLASHTLLWRARLVTNYLLIIIGLYICRLIWGLLTWKLFAYKTITISLDNIVPVSVTQAKMVQFNITSAILPRCLGIIRPLPSLCSKLISSSSFHRTAAGTEPMISDTVRARDIIIRWRVYVGVVQLIHWLCGRGLIPVVKFHLAKNMAETMYAEANKELFISYGREPETVNFVRLLKRDLEKNG